MKNMPEYDVQKKNRAALHGTLRGVVCVYLVFLAWQVVRGLPSSAMPGWAGWCFAAVFAAAAAAFGLYSWNRYKKDLAGALLRPETEPGADEKA